MPELRSVDELRELRRRIMDTADDGRPRLVICAETACQASGANEMIRAAKRHILENGLIDRVGLQITGCHGFCETGPSVLTQPQGAFYPKVRPDTVARIIDAVIEGRYVEDLLYRDEATNEPYYRAEDIPFFRNQRRVMLAMNQRMDPIRIYDYIAQRGYEALEGVLTRRDPDWVIEQVKRSALRGRGGAGFPTGRKWELLARQPGGRGRILICNADEGDPGAYMDRSILEANPHSVIEGMLIGAFGTGATEGIVYVRNEYPQAIKHLTIALRQAREHGLLGRMILGTDLTFDISAVRGAGAFVCGEETALIRSIEGHVGEPRQRPPFPVEQGVDGKPTAINNVETWANIPLIFRVGAEEYAKIGTDGNAGNKIFSLVGKIRNTGLVEVPMGTTIRQIVYDIGGGSRTHARIKAVQTGGPSGGCIPAELFDLPIDYESLAQAGSIMGSGGMIVMDENTCMIDVAKYFMKFLMDESCGKCFTCRKGTQRMYELLDDITRGKGTSEHLDLLEELAHVVRDTTMCGLGQSAPNPVLSTLRYFRKEYEEHVYQKRCRAFVCRDLVAAPCQTACPLDTEAWKYVAHISRGEYEDAYRTIREANPFPSVCARVCSHPCEVRCRRGTTGDEPIAIRALKRFVTDRVDPSAYTPPEPFPAGDDAVRIAVIGSGPAGLTAAHGLSLKGYRVTVFEADSRPGGMLVSGIPSYRLPRDTLEKEISALFNENVELRCGAALGRDFTIDGLFEDGFKAVFLAMGAHRSRTLGLEGEDAEGVYPAIEFLKAFNLRGEQLARGRVGVVGGGDSAVDAAGVAVRQLGVDNVSLVDTVALYYRRTRTDMPAQKQDLERVLQEGVALRTLVVPTRILTKGGRLTGVELTQCRLGRFDSSGRRTPEPVPGTEQTVPLDTLIVTIGDSPDADFAPTMGVELTPWGTVQADSGTLQTSRPGVFAGGDVVTGPNTVVDAIATGKRAVGAIDRWVRGERMTPFVPVSRPSAYVEPVKPSAGESGDGRRAMPPLAPPEIRRRAFTEVEKTLSETEAQREARRCLRCDLEFLHQADSETAVPVTVGASE